MRAWVERFREHLEAEKRASPHTVRAYLTNVEQLRRVHARERRAARAPACATLTSRCCVLTLPRCSSRTSRSTIARKLSAVRAFLRFLRRERVIEENVAMLVRPPEGEEVAAVVPDASSRRARSSRRRPIDGPAIAAGVAGRGHLRGAVRLRAARLGVRRARPRRPRGRTSCACVAGKGAQGSRGAARREGARGARRAGCAERAGALAASTTRCSSTRAAAADRRARCAASSTRTPSPAASPETHPHALRHSLRDPSSRRRAPICARSRSCSVTRRSRPRRATRTSISSILHARTRTIRTRAHAFKTSAANRSDDEREDPIDDHPLGAARRQGRRRRRRPGHARRHGHEGATRKKVRRMRDGKVVAGFAGSRRRRHHAVREARGQARGVQRQPARAPPSSWPRTGAPTACCAGSRRCSIVADARRTLHPLRHRRRDRARRRRRRDRLGRRLRARRRARAARRTPSSARARSPSARSTIAGDICIYTNTNITVEELYVTDCQTETCATLTPRAIVEELDRYIVGQRAAKRAVAIALRNRWRRQQVARRAARRDRAEEHHHDRPDRRREDRDRAPPRQARAARRSSRSRRRSSPRSATSAATSSRWCATWSRSRSSWCATRSRPRCAPRAREARRGAAARPPAAAAAAAAGDGGRPIAAAAVDGRGRRRRERRRTREKLRELLRDGKLDDREVEVEVAPSQQHRMFEVLQRPQGIEEMGFDVQDMLQAMFGRKTKRKRRKVKVPEARELLDRRGGRAS